jgi:outer membrane receptor protein involved in Fe transport
LGPDAAAGVPVADENIYNNFGVKAEGSAQWTGPLRSLDLGVEFRGQNVQGVEGIGDGLRWDNIGSVSAQGLWGLASDLSLDLGGRLDWHETYEAVVFNPEGTLKYLLGTGQDVFFSAGTGYRYADFDELFHPPIAYVTGPDTPAEFGNGETGNPDLKPETSVNLELGTDLLWGNVLLKISGFMKNFSNLIVPAQNDSGYWTFLNVAHARQAGGEAGLRWEIWKELTFNSDYTYVDSRDTDSDVLIPSRMRQKFSMGLSLEPVSGFVWNWGGRFVDHNPAVFNGPQDSPPLVAASSYWVMDTGLKLELDKNLKFFLSVDNLLNQTFATFQGLPMPGRTMEAGAVLGF